MADKEIGMSEMANELKKASRLFKVFEKAAQAASVLANLEREESTLSKQVAELLKERQELDMQCDEIHASLEKAKEDLFSTEAERKKIDKVKASLMKTAEAGARARAAEIVADAKDELGSLVSQIASLKKERKAIEKEHVMAKNELQDTITQITNVKQEALSKLAG